VRHFSRFSRSGLPDSRHRRGSFSVWTERKRIENLRSRHRNPVWRWLVMRKVKGNVKGSGQECPLYTSRRENARDSCESRAGWYRV